MNDRELFIAALQLNSSEDRAAYLDSACGTDQERRQRIEKLLQRHEESESFLNPDLVERTAAFELHPSLSIDPPPLEQAGDQIGPYKLLQQIGEGGMGVVFMAEQHQPLKRRVALKIIKPGLDSRQIIARFEAERQALAMMDHINIARVIDGGTIDSEPRPSGSVQPLTNVRGSESSSCRPYFVMELVHGIPITKYCDENHLTPRERLELFIPVCQAVQHAHQKGIIHRDIKPSNVLVTNYDGKPVPKVIDFGVAKAIDQKLTESTLFTNFGGMVGTLEYMSPEQAEINNLGVDTRSDIYSLGVLLYELLTGSTPLTRQRLKQAANLEILRMIKEEEPQKPSTRISESGDALSSISAQRKMEPAKLTRFVRGELDWIVMKTLEKDRNRRYETANGFAADIQRYLLNEPVQACAPSAGYRLRKFVQRNRSSVVAASLLLLALVGGIIGTTLGLIEARSAKKAAETRETETQAVLDFIESKVFDAARPKGDKGGLGHDVTLRKAVEAALPVVEKGFMDKPLIEARLRLKLGEMFSAVGNDKIGAEQCQIAILLNTKHRGPDHPETLRAKHRLAVCLSHLGKNKEAATLVEEILAIRKAKLGPNDRETLRTMTTLAFCYSNLNQEREAHKLQEETFALQKSLFGLEDEDTLRSRMNLAAHSADYDVALKQYEEILPIMKRKLGTTDRDTLLCIANIGRCYTRLGRYKDALKLRESVFPSVKEDFGPDHLITIEYMAGLIGSYNYCGRYEDALKLNETLVPLLNARFGPDYPLTIIYTNDRGLIYTYLGRNADAVQLHEKMLALSTAKHGPKHMATVRCRSMLIEVLADCPDLTIRNPGRAVELAKANIELDPDNVGNWFDLGMAQYRAGDWKAAVPTLEKSLKLNHTCDGHHFFFLALAHCQLNHMEEARKWFEQAVQYMDKRVDKNNNLEPYNADFRRYRAEFSELMKSKEIATTTK